MKRHATDRLPVAIGLTVIGALIAVLAGYAEVALATVPWVVLLVLGSANTERPDVAIALSLDNDRVMVGDQVEINATISSTQRCHVKVGPKPAAAFWSSDVADEDRRVVAQVDAVTAHTATELSFELDAYEWGTHDLGRARVDVLAPYGLFQFAGGFAERRSVRVHPEPTKLRDLLTPWLVKRVSGTHPSGETSRGIEYADLREFAAGDSMRDINWRASARSNDLMVSQRHPDRATDVILLVDSFVESGHDARAVFSSVIEATVALAESHLAATDRVGLIEFGGLLRWVAPNTGRMQLQRVADAVLATGLFENAAKKDLPLLSPRALPPRSFLIALTPLLDQRFIDAIFTAHKRGHDVAVIACVPNEVLAADPSDAEQVSRRIRDAEQEMLRDRMASQGIASVQWEATEHLDAAIGELLRRRRRSGRMKVR